MDLFLYALTLDKNLEILAERLRGEIASKLSPNDVADILDGLREVWLDPIVEGARKQQ